MLIIFKLHYTRRLLIYFKKDCKTIWDCWTLLFLISIALSYQHYIILLIILLLASTTPGIFSLKLSFVIYNLHIPKQRIAATIPFHPRRCLKKKEKKAQEQLTWFRNWIHHKGTSFERLFRSRCLLFLPGFYRVLGVHAPQRPSRMRILLVFRGGPASGHTTKKIPRSISTEWEMKLRGFGAETPVERACCCWCWRSRPDVRNLLRNIDEWDTDSSTVNFSDALRRKRCISTWVGDQSFGIYQAWLTCVITKVIREPLKPTITNGCCREWLMISSLLEMD